MRVHELPQFLFYVNTRAKAWAKRPASAHPTFVAEGKDQDEEKAKDTATAIAEATTAANGTDEGKDKNEDKEDGKSKGE